MNSLQKITRLAVFALVIMVLAIGSASAQTAARTLTVGTVSGTVGGADVLVPITINDAAGVGGIAFTLTYNPALFTFKGLEQVTGGWTINDGSAYSAGQNPYTATPPVANATLFYQFNDMKDGSNNPVGRVLVAGASAEPLTGTVLFRAKFGIKAGINGTTYPIGIGRSIINNPAAGYAADTMIPALVGTGDKVGGMYTTLNFPVIPATLFAGGITVSATTHSLGGRVTYASTPVTNAVGCTVVLTRETATGGYVFNDQRTVGSDGRYNFTAKDVGKYKISVTSLDPNYNNFESGVITLSANETNANAVLTLKPQPVRVSGAVTGNIPGLLAQVIDPTGKVMGTFSIGTDGRFTSPLLPALETGQAYRWHLIYGSLSSGPFDNNGTTTFNTAVLKTISGTIAGLPAGGGAVTASSVAGKITKTLQAFDGTYTVTDLVAANDYIVSAVATGLPLTYFDGKTDVNEATRVDISTTKPSATGISFNFVPPQSLITGWIKESDAGVNLLTVYGFEVNTFALITTQTNTSGNYSLSVPKGTYEVFVIKGNGKIFYFANVDGTPTQNQSNAVLRAITTDGQTIANTNISITEFDKTLGGKVTYNWDRGEPAANVLITVSDAKTRAQGLTGQDGRYTIGGLEGGKAYTVTMKPLIGNYAVQTTSIVAGTDTTRDFIIDTGWVLSGTVTEKDSSPVKNVSGAMLYLKDRATGALVGGRIYFSAANGAYSIRDIKSGEYTLEVAHEDYRSFTVNLVIGSNMTQLVALEKGAHFKGTVTDNRSPARLLAGATIIVTRTGATPVYTVTNSAGFYSVYGLDSTKSDYIIIAQARGYERQAITGRNPATAGTTANFVLVPPAQHWTLSGTVKTDAQTNPGIGGAIVLVSSASKNFFASTTTAATTGAYSVANLIASTDYRIVVIPQGLPTRERTIAVAGNIAGGGENENGNFTFAVGREIGGTITGVTSTGSLAPFPSGVKIYVFLYKGDVYEGFQTAGTNGGFLFKGLADGTDYKVLAVATGYTPRWWNAKATSGDAIMATKLDVNIQLIRQ